MVGWIAAGATAIGTLFQSNRNQGPSAADLYWQQREAEANQAQQKKTLLIIGAVLIVLIIAAIWYYKKK